MKSAIWKRKRTLILSVCFVSVYSCDCQSYDTKYTSIQSDINEAVEIRFRYATSFTANHVPEYKYFSESVEGHNFILLKEKQNDADGIECIDSSSGKVTSNVAVQFSIETLSQFLICDSEGRTRMEGNVESRGSRYQVKVLGSSCEDLYSPIDINDGY